MNSVNMHTVLGEDAFDVSRTLRLFKERGNHSTRKEAGGGLMNNRFNPLQIFQEFAFTIRTKLFIIFTLFTGLIPVFIYIYLPMGIESKSTIALVGSAIFIVGMLAASLNLIWENLEIKARELQEEIKERKSAAEALKQAEAEKGILQEQLRQSQKMESIGKLAGGIVHDFNNILSVIIGYVDLTLGSVAAGSAEEHNLKRVMAASVRAKDLAKQLLIFSRNGDNDRKPLWLNEEVGEALKLMRATMPASIEFREDIAGSSIPVMADKYELQQVIMNLCINASHAMKEKGGVLSISLREVGLEPNAIDGIRLRPGYYHHLTVSDTGHGIDPGILPRIFEPYFTTKGKDEGVGMGLEVVHRIVKNYGGDITVYSEPGKGTTFHVFLPGVGQKEKKHNADADVELPENGAGEQVLFVDDDPSLLELGERLLQKLGYRVAVRTRSPEAFELFCKAPNRFDIVVSDYIMPKMTGLQLAREIKRIRADIPIIMCTGFSESVNKDNFKALGIDGFLMKPILINKLARLVRQLLDKKRVACFS
jgi:signal transduction histidine kinase/ActR/RegA family two-component response regulator